MHISSKMGLSSALLALLGAASLQPAQAQVYNAANDFEAGYLAHQNPNGVWEYGWTQNLPSAASPLHLFTVEGTGPDSSNEQNLTDPNNDQAHSPAVNYSTSAFNDGNINVAANTLFATPIGTDGHADADIVFVAPTSTTYALSATFLGVQNNDNADVHILANGVSLLNSTITSFGQTASYSGNVFLTQGQIINFAFGPNNAFNLHPANVGLSANLIASPAVSVVPESSGLANMSGALLALALGGLVMAVKKKAKAKSAT